MYKTTISYNQLIDILEKIVADFHINSFLDSSGVETFYGVHAFNCLKKFMIEGKIDLKNTVRIKPHLNYYQLFSWVFDVVIARRQLLSISVKSVLYHRCLKKKQLKKIIDNSIECAKLWKMFKYILTKNYVRDITVFDCSYLEVFQNVILAEDVLITSIEVFLNSEPIMKGR